MLSAHFMIGHIKECFIKMRIIRIVMIIKVILNMMSR